MDTSTYKNPNFSGQTTDGSYATGTPISATGLGTTTTPITLPTPAAPMNAAATNASIPTPPPQTAEQIYAAANAPTATENQASALMNKVADLIGGNTSLATLQTTEESKAGIPALTGTVNDLTTQLQGLNDQSAKLTLDAQPGGTIDNKNTEASIGIRGQGGIDTLNARDLRKTQIQQASIAGQALTVKAAYYAASGRLSLAKDAADKAAQVTFDAKQQEIDHQKALLDAIKPTLDKEQTARAATLKAQLDDRQRVLDQQTEDHKTGTALVIAAMKLNPNNTAAQFAAQSALKLDPNDPQYLNKVMNLVGKYQQDPVATQNAILDQQYKRAQINSTNALANQRTGQGGGNVTPATPGAQNYDALTIRRYNLAANAALKPYLNLPGYSLTANGTAYLSRIQSAIQNPGSISDQDLLDSITKLNNAGGQVTEAQVNTVLRGASLADKANVWQNYLTKNGGVLSNDQRQQLVQVANAVFAGYKKMYQPIYDKATANLKAQGIPEAFWNIPDLNKLAEQSQTPKTAAAQTSQFDNLANDITPSGTNAYIPRNVWSTVSDKDGLLAYVKSLGFTLLVK